jgi:uncharacterized membrane protein
MTIALVILSIFLGLASAMSAMGKFTKMEQTIATLKSVGVKDSQIPVLGALELAGALGLLIGIWVPILGHAAAVGIALYFAGAVIAHTRAGHPFKQIIPATVLLLVALAVVLIQIAI